MVMHVIVLFHEAEALSKCEYYEVFVIATKKQARMNVRAVQCANQKRGIRK